MNSQAPDLVRGDEVERAKVSYYSFSVLFSGLARMWRAWRVSLVVVLVNAAAQGLLILGSAGAISTPVFLLSVVASALVLLAAAALVTAASLDSVTGRATWGSVIQRIRPRILRFTLWTVGLAVLVVIGLAFGGWPGLLLTAILPFVVLGAIAGERNPLKANFLVIFARPIRWAFTLLIIGGIAFVAWIFMAAWWFFVPGVIGAAISTFVGGMLTWWWSTSLACIYRSVRDGVVDSPPNVTVDAAIPATAD